MTEYNSVDLLACMSGVSLVEYKGNKVIINIAKGHKAGVKAYLGISTDEFEIIKTEKTLFGFQVTIKIKELITFHSTKSRKD